jgi:tripartite-type tricarboxylate transporter receptor subunit TctC
MRPVLLKFIAAFFAVLIAAGISGARAENYPSRPVRIVVPAAAGGGIDFTARLVAAKLQSALGEPFVVENRDGASGSIGTQDVARAQPDGYTLLLTISGFQVTNPAVFPSLRLDPLRDFSGVALIMRAPHVLVVNKNSPFNSLRDLVNAAAANPGKLTYASPGVGTQSQIAAEMLAQAQHLKIRAIPYRGTGPALNDLLAGSVDMFVNTTQSLIGPLQGGAIKGLAILNPTRHPLLPNIPTAAEAGFPGLEIYTWYALYARGSPARSRSYLKPTTLRRASIRAVPRPTFSVLMSLIGLPQLNSPDGPTSSTSSALSSDDAPGLHASATNAQCAARKL